MNGYTEEFQLKNKVLHVRLSGKFPTKLCDNKENLFRPLIEACSTHNCKKALIDATDLKIDFKTMEMYRAGVDAAFLARIGLRIALLAREDMLDPFFDNVAKNRGAVIGVFTDIDKASRWLDL